MKKTATKDTSGMIFIFFLFDPPIASSCSFLLLVGCHVLFIFWRRASSFTLRKCRFVFLCESFQCRSTHSLECEELSRQLCPRLQSARYTWSAFVHVCVFACDTGKVTHSFLLRFQGPVVSRSKTGTPAWSCGPLCAMEGQGLLPYL